MGKIALYKLSLRFLVAFACQSYSMSSNNELHKQISGIDGIWFHALFFLSVRNVKQGIHFSTHYAKVWKQLGLFTARLLPRDSWACWQLHVTAISVKKSPSG